MFDIPEFNLSLIRHGESETNAQPDKIGQTCDDPLTSLGMSQAKKLYDLNVKRNQKWDIVYTSHYHRALNTAKIATGRSFDELIIIPDLREYGAGDWIGASRSQIITSEVKYKMNTLGQGFLPPNGESLNQVQRRASAWLDDSIINNKIVFDLYKQKNAPLEIAAFSHGLTIKTLLQYVMGFDKIFTWKIVINNTSVSKLSFDKEGWRVLSINDCSHLI